jgi:hypothetical protein
VLLTLLIVLIVIALLFGGWGSFYSGPTYRSSYGYWGWSPLIILVVVLLILWALGVFR